MPPPAKKYPFEIAPPSSVASPNEVDAGSDEKDVPFWTPSWSEAFSQLGWQWLWFVPAVAAVIAVFVIVPMKLHTLPILLGFYKILVIVIGLPFVLVGYAITKTVQRRTEPFCIHCGYTLVGLPDGSRCPECGRRFNLKIVEEYRRDPRWFASRWRANRVRPPADVPFTAGQVRRKPSRDGT